MWWGEQFEGFILYKIYERTYYSITIAWGRIWDSYCDDSGMELGGIAGTAEIKPGELGIGMDKEFELD